MIDASHTPIDVTPASDWLAGNPEGQLQLANSVKFGSDWLAAHPDARPEYYQGNNNLVNANSDARDLFRAMLGPSIIDSPLVHPGAGEIALRSLSGLAGRQLIVQPPEGALINGNTSAWELGDSVSRGMRFLSENPGFRPQFIQNGSDTYEPFDGSAEQLQDRMWLNIYNRLGTGQYALRTLMDLAPERVTNRDLRIDPTADGARAGVAVSMLKGLRWLSENPSAQPEFGTDGKMYFPENQEAVALRKAMGLDESGVGTSDFSLRIMAERTRTAFGNRVTIHPDPEASAPVDYNKEIWAVLPYLEIEGKVSDGQRWLRMNPDARPEFKNVDGKYIPANADAAALSNAMPLRLQSAFATNDIYLDVLRQQTDRVSLIDPASSSDASDRGALVIPAATNEVTDTQ
jgi:hypothetical protein